MATLLRKSRSVVQAKADHHSNNANNEVPPPLPPKDSSSNLLHQFSSSIRNRRKSRVDVSNAIESEQSGRRRQQQQQEEHLRKQHSIAQLRRRLVRKASTFNLHTRHRSRSDLQTDIEAHTRSEHLFPDIGDEAVQLDAESYDIARVCTASTVYSEAAETLLRRSATSASANSQITTIPARCSSLLNNKPLPQLQSAPGDAASIFEIHREVSQAQRRLAEQFPAYREKHHELLGVWAKMATPTAEPPLPYEKLKQITVEACDSTLGQTRAYDHAKTELWNTTIINTILAELVGETQSTPAANGATSAAPQSKYKFVVNSTIVQHRSSTVDEAGRGHGRRGMHSAAGAYWNNEKDGMWSFKYEAAEKMGLDVVVGIVWIWVG